MARVGIAFPPRDLDPGIGKRRFLHIIKDDKFIDEARGLFEEAAPGAHDYLLPRPPGRLRHIRTFQPVAVDLGAILAPRFMARFAAYRAVFIHLLGRSARQIVAAAPPGATFAWLGWGADYAHLMLSREALLLPRTRALVADLPTRRHRLPPIEGLGYAVTHPAGTTRRLVSLARCRDMLAGGRREDDVLQRIALFAPVLAAEYDAIVAAHARFAPGYVRWNYWTPGLGEDAGPVVPDTGDILVGNSATPENNHLDAFHSIGPTLPAGSRVICPLSYGDAAYGDRVEREGRAIWGDRFVPLRSFLPADAYARLVGNCPVVVMNHVRQQAMGTLLMLAWRGARLFLNPKSPAMGEMVRLGARAHAIDHVSTALASPMRRPDAGELARVRERIRLEYGRPALVDRTRELLAKASNAG